MRLVDILLAVVAGVMIGYAVAGSTDAAWAGPVAGVAATFVLIGINRLGRGGRHAR